MASVAHLYPGKIFRFYAKNKWQNVCIYAKKCVPLHIERWEVVSHLKLKLLNIMKSKRISLTRKEMQMIIFALGDGISARKELATKCRTASESGVETIDKKGKWIEYAERAEKETEEYEMLREKFWNVFYE